MSSWIVAPELLATDTVATLLCQPGRVSPLLGLSAYSGGYPARMEEALADTFEATARIVGDEAFSRLVLRYTRRHRPVSYNLNDIGRKLARHLRSDPLIRTHPQLADLAELEWKIATAFHARLAPPADVAAMAAWTPAEWERARVRLQPGLGVVVSRWPVLSLWDALVRQHEPAHDAPASRAAESVIVYRRELAVRTEIVAHEEARALRALRSGRPLAVVLDAAAQAGADAADVSGWIARWHGRGLIVAIELAPLRATRGPRGSGCNRAHPRTRSSPRSPRRRDRDRPSAA